MTVRTVDIGIDLGTTNSSIACFERAGVRVFKNRDDKREITPSAVYIDPRGQVVVGSEAYERLGHDPDNTTSEFKRLMGSADARYHFVNSGKTMTPEDLSAEVLKSLKGDAEPFLSEPVRAAVITVPAMFTGDQSAATGRAGELAGIEHVVVMMEPIAAAVAYSFDKEPTDTFWMVYDLGGGTFDITIVRNGVVPTVVSNKGDNFLGGKNFDWSLVDRLILPRLKEQYALSDMNREEKKGKYYVAVAKLKWYAEQAKIRLSSREVATIDIPELCHDLDNRRVDVMMDIRRSELEELLKPFLERTVTICKGLLKESRLAPSNVERLILVGGPTYTPILREMLRRELGIPLETGCDPMTVVAQGAAIHARAVRWDDGGKPPPERGAFVVDLRYPPISSDVEVLLAGKVCSSETGAPPAGGYTIEVRRGDKGWHSRRVSLGKDGEFAINVLLQERRANEFIIELHDPYGAMAKVLPADRFTIIQRRGGGIQPRLARSLGIGLSDGTMCVYLKKDEPLPARSERHIHATVVGFSKGDSGVFLRVPVYEGEHARADRNVKIGGLEIPAEKFPIDLPKNSEVEVRLEVDESRRVRAFAYLPRLDQEFPWDGKGLRSPDPHPDELRQEFSQARERLEKSRSWSRQNSETDVTRLLGKIERENTVQTIEDNLAAAGGEVDPARCAQSMILDLEATLDKVDDAMEWPKLKSEATSTLEWASEEVRDHGDSKDKKQLTSLKKELDAALETKDADQVKLAREGLASLASQVLLRRPEVWVALFNEDSELFSQNPNDFTDKNAARRLIERGRQAVNSNDINMLQEMVRELRALRVSDSGGPGENKPSDSDIRKY